MRNLNVDGSALSDGLKLQVDNRIVTARVDPENGEVVHLDVTKASDNSSPASMDLILFRCLMYLPVFLQLGVGADIFSQQLANALAYSIATLFVLSAVRSFYLVKGTREKKRWHGAEHMVINAYEQNLDLTVENVRSYSRAHRRCGSTTLIMPVVLVLILALSGNLLIAWALSWFALFMALTSWGFITVPFQYLLFTSKPTDRQLEVAIMAMNRLQQDDTA